MGMPNLLRKVCCWTAPGLRVTFRTKIRKRTTPEQYPLDGPRWPSGTGERPVECEPRHDETMCIAAICVRWLSGKSDRGLERNATRNPPQGTHNFTYDLSRCMFCGLCEDACPTDALELTQDFELANYSRENMIWDARRSRRATAHCVQEVARVCSCRTPPGLSSAVTRLSRQVATKIPWSECAVTPDSQTTHD